MSHSILKVPFDLISYDDVALRVESWRAQRERRFVCLVNPHSVMLGRRDARTQAAFASASLNLPDGAGTILAAKILGYPHRGRVAGPTLMLRLCERGCEFGWRHFFFGGAAGVAENLALRLKSQFPEMIVAGTFSPPFRELTAEERTDALSTINESRPDIVWVGLGAPKQEQWMAQHVGQIEAAALAGVGAAFDFHVGTVPWAPGWIRRIGCEWAFRLYQEPKRMWRRNLDSPAFVSLVLLQRLGKLFGRSPS